ncbi:uncharacterized protein LOC133895186 [Phragmites australis]|uniref:uncharacterized protein LOC133895186 n=1 Tax=Phragmites australis TaxID=29695 RepID=UPI002D770862|nr:uncharacterized protein LOC133895186 [Phragmites australis]
MVQNIRLGHVLVDGGSSINLLFANALDTLQISRSVLKLSHPFFEITPGSSAKPLGQIELPVTFGSPGNFRTEMVPFDMVDFETTYNAILGQLAIAQFMAIAHYTYQAIKIPGLAGAITIFGNAKTALHSDKRSLVMVELDLGSQLENARPSGRPVKVHIIASIDDRLKAIFLDDSKPSKTV